MFLEGAEVWESKSFVDNGFNHAVNYNEALILL